MLVNVFCGFRMAFWLGGFCVDWWAVVMVCGWLVWWWWLRCSVGCVMAYSWVWHPCVVKLDVV